MTGAVSPLRYPGGKSSLAPVVRGAVSQLNCRTLVEPFAGGAGVGVSLLAEGIIDQLVLADYDWAIASFWQAISQNPERLASMFERVELSMDEWRHQKSIYHNSTDDVFQQALSTLYLSRTCYSGNLGAGPVGGWGQQGTYTIASRFYRETITARIRTLESVKDRITAIHAPFEWTIANCRTADVFFYADPPYPVVGDRLYRFSFKREDHIILRDLVTEQENWLVSYGDNESIRQLWGDPQQSPELQYCASSHPRRQRELLYSCPRLGW